MWLAQRESIAAPRRAEKSGFRALARNSSSKLQAAVVAVVVLAVAFFAVRYDGAAHTDLDLHDGGVWVSNADESLVAHLNYQSRTLDAGLNPVSTQFDLSQEGNEVLLADAASADYKAIDTAKIVLSDPVANGMSVAHGEQMVLVADTNKNRVWALRYDQIGTFSDSSTPLISSKDPVALAVTPDDHAFMLDASGTVYEVTLGEGDEEKPTSRKAGEFGVKPSEKSQFTAVGEQPVLYQDGTIYTLADAWEVSQARGADAVKLQQPSRGADAVALATATELILVDLASGQVQATPAPTDLPQPGVAVTAQNAAENTDTTAATEPAATAVKGEAIPAAPVMVNKCAYGAWAGTGGYLKQCANGVGNQSLNNAALATMRDAVFRTSRTTVVINDAKGTVLLPNAGMAVVDNWDVIKQQIQDAEKENEEEQETDQQNLIEEQQPPVAVDDELGARVGTTTMLPVLANDTDPNGDVLTAVLQDVPEGLKVGASDGGRALQVELAANQTAPVSFTYKAFDGVAYSENAATVRLIPKAESENSAPYLTRSRVVQLAEQATVSYYVLPDWIDPEGDPMFLAAATADDTLEINFRSDGFLSIRDNGTAGPRNAEINVSVSDGKAEASGVIPVKISSAATNVPPVAYADFYTVNVGATVEISPLSNDYDPNGSPLKLTQVSEAQADEKISVDYDQGRISFSSQRPGSHVLTYTVTDGMGSTSAKIRVDVIGESENTLPTAQNDIALLPAGESATVAVLENDSDPQGKVLVLQSVAVPAGIGITAEMIDHAKLLISAPASVTTPQTISYTISNGTDTASAKVLVVPQSAKATNVPPVASADSAIVRAADIVSVAVLSNDYSPTGLGLTLDSEFQVRSGAELGEAFVSGNSLRFKAGEKAGTAQIVYTIRDEAGNIASALATITVRDIASGNSAPSPRPVVARAFAGQEIVIPIPLAGVDPDGDSVELAQDSSKGPSLGAVIVEEGALRYTAQPGASGTDTFTYKVRDRFKATGEATVQVGIAPVPGTNQLPVAVPDEVRVQPGRLIDIPVTANDIDSDGDPILLVAGSIQAISNWEPNFSLDGNRVVLTSPRTPGTYQFSYDITDGGGVNVTGFVSVIVGEDVPLQPPIARDDRVKLADVVSRKEVSVPVLDNDTDPDGATSELKLEVQAPARVDGANVVVPVTGEYQVVLYSIIDPDGFKASAAVFVPGADGAAPMLDPKKIPAQATGAHPITIDLNDYVIVRAGRSPKITSSSTVTAGRGGSAEVGNNGVRVLSEIRIEFTPDKDFDGTTSVSFEVYDGKTLEDPEGLRATLSLPVQVTPAVKTRPRVRPSAISVEPGETAVTADIAGMVADPDEGDMEIMSYRLVSASPEFQVRLSGATLSVATAVTTPVGTTGTAVIEVDDHSTEPVQMTIPLSVVASNRPLMLITAIDEPEGRVGEAKTFDLLAQITNPFAKENGAITISDVKQTAGPAATVALNGTSLSITPSDVGTITITYLGTDATKATERQVVGMVTIRVKDKPLAPTGLTARSDASQTAVVNYTQGDLRGGTLQRFIVRWEGGQQDCALATDCQITGLTNNVTYNFTVVQVTEVGESPASNSASARPDVKPNTPGAPTANFGDSSAILSWDAVSVPEGGSPVKLYRVRGNGGAVLAETSGTSTTVTGLKNGTAYTFSIQAVNDYAAGNAARESEFAWGAESNSVVPAGPPSGIAAPSVTRDSPTTANVCWSAPANPNGDSDFNYQLTDSGNGQSYNTGNATCFKVTMEVSATDRTFSVRANNKSRSLAAGGNWGEASAASPAIRAYGEISAVSNLRVEATGDSNTLRFTFDPASGAGINQSEIKYSWSISGFGYDEWITSGAAVTNVSHFPDGVPVTVNVTAQAAVPDGKGGKDYLSGPAVTATATPYGPPAAANVIATSQQGNVHFEWAVSTNSGGKPLDTSSPWQLHLTHDGMVLTPGLYSVGGNPSQGFGAVDVGTFAGQEICLEIQIRNTEGQLSDWSQLKCATALP